MEASYNVTVAYNGTITYKSRKEGVNTVVVPTIVVRTTPINGTLTYTEELPTIDGDEVTVRIAPGTSNGRTLRVKGRGIESSKGHGDLLITIDVQVPQRVDGVAKKALEDFAAATKEFNPRIDLAQKAKA